MRNEGRPTRCTRRGFMAASGAMLAISRNLLPRVTFAFQTTKVQLRFANWGSPERQAAVSEAFGLLRKEQPDIEITAEFSSADAYPEKLATQLSGGDAPQLIQTYMGIFPTFANRGAFLDLSQFVPKVIDLTGWDKNAVDIGRIDGRLLGLNFVTNAYATFYNQSVLEKLGLTMPAETWTWDDFADFSGKIRDASNGKLFGSEDGGGEYQALEVWVRQRGKNLFTAGGKLGFDRSDLTEWLTFWDGLRKSGAVPPGDVTAQFNQSAENEPMVRGLAAMQLLQTSNLLSEHVDLTGADIRPHVLPNGPEGSQPGNYLRASVLLDINAKADHPDIVATVVNTLANDPKVGVPFARLLGVPVSPSVRDAYRAVADPLGLQEIEFIEQVAKLSSPAPPPAPTAIQDVTDLLQRTNEGVAFGQTTVADAVDQFFTGVDQILGQ